jgi:hypothetical protein
LKPSWPWTQCTNKPKLGRSCGLLTCSSKLTRGPGGLPGTSGIDIHWSHRHLSPVSFVFITGPDGDEVCELFMKIDKLVPYELIKFVSAFLPCVSPAHRAFSIEKKNLFSNCWLLIVCHRQGLKIINPTLAIRTTVALILGQPCETHGVQLRIFNLLTRLDLSDWWWLLPPYAARSRFFKSFSKNIGQHCQAWNTMFW